MSRTARPAPQCFDAPTAAEAVEAYHVSVRSRPSFVREHREVYGGGQDEGGPDEAQVRDDEATPVPDPFDDAEALDELGHRITTLAAHIAAATHRFLVLLADFDRRRGWELGGHRSCAHWLHVATAMKLHTAREKVRVARKLVGLPETSRAMSRGELSFSQVRELSRVATPECEGELIELARSTTVADLSSFVSQWRTLSRADEETLERARYRLRRFSVVPDGEGMYVVKGRVTAEVGAALMRAIDAAGDALFCPDAKEQTTPKQRRADALGLVAERALAVGFGGEGCGPAEADEDVPAGTPGRLDAGTGGDGDEAAAEVPRGTSGRLNDGMGGESADERNAAGSGGAPVPVSGSRAERYQVMLHVKAEGSHLEDGTGVPRGTSRRLCCDVSVVTVSRAENGDVLDVGRRTRTIPPALRRALEVRDNGCRFPGCGLRFTDGHHLIHWADGGETRLDNLVLLCRYHHRLVHEGGWRVELWGKHRHAAFIDPRGGIHMDTEWTGSTGKETGGLDELDGLDLANDRPTADLPDNAADALLAENHERGLRPTGWSLWAENARPAAVPYALRASAVEALDAAHFGV